ncbi:hypothetical protein C5O75_014785 [Burkholderia cepacia]|nr:hypothetical protein C5O75_014785 [Burkholderia cepacia]
MRFPASLAKGGAPSQPARVGCRLHLRTAKSSARSQGAAGVDNIIPRCEYKFTHKNYSSNPDGRAAGAGPAGTGSPINRNQERDAWRNTSSRARWRDCASSICRGCWAARTPRRSLPTTARR